MKRYISSSQVGEREREREGVERVEGGEAEHRSDEWSRGIALLQASRIFTRENRPREKRIESQSVPPPPASIPAPRKTKFKELTFVLACSYPG